MLLCSSKDPSQSLLVKPYNSQSSSFTYFSLRVLVPLRHLKILSLQWNITCLVHSCILRHCWPNALNIVLCYWDISRTNQGTIDYDVHLFFVVICCNFAFNAMEEYTSSHLSIWHFLSKSFHTSLERE